VLKSVNFVIASLSDKMVFFGDSHILSLLDTKQSLKLAVLKEIVSLSDANLYKIPHK
jgi:hypothetical protein